MTSELVGYIPVGGLGERLRPLTTNFPKPLLLMGEGDKRIIDFPLFCINKSANRVLVATAFCHEHFDDYFKDRNDNLTLLRDQHLLNVGGSLLQHYKLISEPGLLGDNLLMIPGDHVVENVDFDEMNRLHIENKADISLGLTEKKQYGDYVSLNKGGKVIEMGAEGNFSYTGICILKSSFLLDELNKIIKRGWDNTNFDLGKSIITTAVNKFNVRGYVFGENSYWDDAGTIDRYFFNNMRLSDGRNVVSPSAEISDNTIITRSIVLDGARVNLNGKLDGVIVPPNNLVKDDGDYILVRQ